MNNSSLQRNIPKGWSIKKIKDLLDYERPDKYIVQNASYDPKGKIPVLTANKSFILGYTNETEGVYTDIPVIIFDDFTTDSKYVDFPFKVKSSAIKILKKKDEHTDLKFIYEIMKSFNFRIANHKRHYISQYQELDLIVPLIDQQKKIAEILSAINEQINKTERFIIDTEKLKLGLMSELFTKGAGHKKFKKTTVGSIPEKWRVVPFESLFSQPLKNGLNRPTKIRGEGVKMVNMGELFKYPKISNQDMEKVPLTEKEAGFLLESGDLLFARQSLVRDGAGKASIFLGSNDPITYEGHLIRVRLDKKTASPLFFFYFFNSAVGRKLINGLISQTAAAGIRGSDLAKVVIPCPEIEEQNYIASILNSVDERIDILRKIKNKNTEMKKGVALELLSGKVSVKNI